MGAFSTAERDQLAKAIFSRICLRERYDKTGGQWVTIGGGPGPGGKQHAGGTPVKIGADGKIAAGPDKLEGKHIDHVDQDKNGAGAFDAEGRPAVGRGDRPAWQGLAEEGDAAAKAGDLDKAQRRWKAAAAAHPGGAEHPEAAELSKRTGAPAAKSPTKGTDADVIRKSLDKVLGGKPEAAKPAQEAPPTATPKDTAPSPATQETPNQEPHGVKEFDDFKLRGGRQVKPLPKGRQLSLFDKLAQQGSPEAKEMPTAAAIARGDGVHRLQNEHGEEPPAGVSVGDGGIWKGTATLHASDIQMDPSRFQYKVSGIGSKGVTKQLADVRRFNPMFGGQLLVWRDPENGKTFVINGHHRLELAQRSEHYEDETTGLKWQGELQSYFIPAKTAEQARAIGALANMAAGHGTATDAAKFMRDTGLGVDDLKGQGISLRGKIATDALALKDLSPGAFDQMVQGMLPESRAIAVSKHLKNPDQQDKLLRKLAERERGGRPVSDEAAAEAAKEMELAGTTSMRGGPGLFGDMDDEHSLEIERGEVKAAIRKSLASERNTFKAVSSTKRATKIQEAGSNVLDVEGNRQRAQRADESLGMFDKLANSRGNL